MSQLQSVVEFTNVVPNLEDVMVRIKEVSGLTDLDVDLNDSFGRFTHPSVTEISFVFFQNENDYTIFYENRDPNYLAAVMIAVLVDLGGNYPIVKSWGRKPWESVKSGFKSIG